MPKITERGLKIKTVLLQQGKKQGEFVSIVQKEHPSFDNKALYDLLYTDRVSKYEQIVFDILNIKDS